MVDFTILGQRFQAITAAPHDDFNDAISIVVACDDQLLKMVKLDIAELERAYRGA